MRFLVYFGLASFLGWLTHIITCFNTGAWGFLIAGAIAAPIGIFHGWYLWIATICNLIGGLF